MVGRFRVDKGEGVPEVGAMDQRVLELFVGRSITRVAGHLYLAQGCVERHRGLRWAEFSISSAPKGGAGTHLCPAHLIFGRA